MHPGDADRCSDAVRERRGPRIEERERGCGGGKVSECLTTLPVELVHQAVIALLAETRAPTAA